MLSSNGKSSYAEEKAEGSVKREVFDIGEGELSEKRSNDGEEDVNHDLKEDSVNSENGGFSMPASSSAADAMSDDGTSQHNNSIEHEQEPETSLANTQQPPEEGSVNGWETPPQVFFINKFLH